MEEFIRRLPKAELHVHIEGTLEPQLMFDLAERNRYELPFPDVESVAAAYKFKNLQSFLDIYYQGAAVLQTPQDFHDLITAYFDQAARDGVRHAEIFFDPQSHTGRGVGFEVFMEGFRSGMADAQSRQGITSALILCFLRHIGGDAALATIREAEPHLDGVVAVGLDSSEKGYPPEPFADAYAHARELGLRPVAHAGEEGPPEYVTGALDVLGVERVDHGVRSLEDPDLVERLRRERIPLTVCPLSNVALRVVDRVVDHPLPEMMEAGLLVSVNSDDPAYFGGYVAENYFVLADDLGFGEQRLAMLAANSIESSFLDEGTKRALLTEIESVEP
ncbi:MAG TPA: adenosine deaminase [Acidimicrobiia bacterium]|nr:adenosine deaminase [Acidimicrobiia bacterium]